MREASETSPSVASYLVVAVLLGVLLHDFFLTSLPTGFLRRPIHSESHVDHAPSQIPPSGPQGPGIKEDSGRGSKSDTTEDSSGNSSEDPSEKSAPERERETRPIRSRARLTLPV
ncbi:MAG: hypothetical protein NDI61_03695 [Bdellovibrionaceae bacterium]|nr:hypothetical protein [Pseudobdellovibrionaceae bacterium]